MNEYTDLHLGCFGVSCRHGASRFHFAVVDDSGLGNDWAGELGALATASMPKIWNSGRSVGRRKVVTDTMREGKRGFYEVGTAPGGNSFGNIPPGSAHLEFPVSTHTLVALTGSGSSDESNSRGCDMNGNRSDSLFAFRPSVSSFDRPGGLLPTFGCRRLHLESQFIGCVL
jgi:hypothetical protein